jgi:hypothetical protein
MLDSAYFQTQLPQDIAAAGGDAVVELRLRSGQFHRVRSVERIAEGYVVLQTYQLRTDGALRKDEWLEQTFDGTSTHDVERAIVPFESILDIVVMASKAREKSKIGFPTR